MGTDGPATSGKRRRKTLIAVLAATALVAVAAGVALAVQRGDASLSPPALELVAVGDFEAPTHVAAPPGDPALLAVVERGGRIWMLRDGRRRARSYVDLRERVASVSESGERGLFSIAFAPDYAVSGLAYAAYTDHRGDLRVDELRRVPEEPERARRVRAVLSVPHRRFDNHNGGQLAFGPDGMLYVGTGDGGGAFDPFGAGQDRGTLLGKILRIDPRGGAGQPYAVPAGNPFAGRRDGRPEIAVLGVRNPWRFSFDRATGDLVVADVGQDEREEVTVLPSGSWLGANLGWSCFEGRSRLHDCPAPGHRPPALERRHVGGECSITGGVVVRDLALPALHGRYLYGDFCTGRLRSVVLGPAGAREDRPLDIEVPLLSSFGEDARGRVYAASLEGPVYRLAPASAPPAGAAGEEAR